MKQEVNRGDQQEQRHKLYISRLILILKLISQLNYPAFILHGSYRNLCYFTYCKKLADKFYTEDFHGSFYIHNPNK
ncbi:hypothetical protein BpHYR1_013415 [Brachionus plicatilis]|uniref:Uncharacterized protein n=1 Tax=Brachionus plicatilis TaxID=10195 RepID=A0A3M7PYI0_BRAPC|nr:hypothetical protein BpHYR1_013415 [Brachionus plicatilis]